MRLFYRCFRYLAVTYLLSLSSLAHADYSSAAKAYEEKHYDQAYAEFRSLAELGHPASQYALGIMYYNGWGVHQNTLLAYGWIHLAADGGNSAALKLEPKIRADIDAENVARAQEILRKFTPTEINARLMPKIIANCEYQNATPPVPISISTPIYPLQMLHGGVQGSVLIELLVAPDSTVRDVRIIDSLPHDAFDEAVRTSAMKWKIKPATRDGKAIPTWVATEVIFKISDAYETSDLTHYLDRIKRMAEDGNPQAQYLYALILSGYPGRQKPWSEALPWMMKAAQGGSAPAQYRVGLSLLHGRGCAVDETKASEWLLRSAQQDNPDAQIELAVLSLKTGPNYDPTKGLFWLEKAAAVNDTKAKKYLAAMLATSPIETMRNPKRAVDLIDEVAKHEKSDAVDEEIRAAAFADSGDYGEAVKMETKAIALAKKSDWDLTDLSARLQRYQTGNAWYGDLFTF